MSFWTKELGEEGSGLQKKVEELYKGIKKLMFSKQMFAGPL